MHTQFHRCSGCLPVQFHWTNEDVHLWHYHDRNRSWGIGIVWAISWRPYDNGRWSCRRFYGALEYCQNHRYQVLSLLHYRFKFEFLLRLGSLEIINSSMTTLTVFRNLFSIGSNGVTARSISQYVVVIKGTLVHSAFVKLALFFFLVQELIILLRQPSAERCGEYPEYSRIIGSYNIYRTKRTALSRCIGLMGKSKQLIYWVQYSPGLLIYRLFYSIFLSYYDLLVPNIHLPTICYWLHVCVPMLVLWEDMRGVSHTRCGGFSLLPAITVQYIEWWSLYHISPSLCDPKDTIKCLVDDQRNSRSRIY